MWGAVLWFVGDWFCPSHPGIKNCGWGSSLWLASLFWVVPSNASVTTIWGLGKLTLVGPKAWGDERCFLVVKWMKSLSRLSISHRGSKADHLQVRLFQKRHRWTQTPSWSPPFLTAMWQTLRFSAIGMTKTASSYYGLQHLWRNRFLRPFITQKTQA